MIPGGPQGELGGRYNSHRSGFVFQAGCSLPMMILLLMTMTLVMILLLLLLINIIMIII